jgi:hypothetical protein
MAKVQKSNLGHPNRFVKQWEDVPNLKIQFRTPRNKALCYSEMVLVGKFTGSWPSPKPSMDG